MDPRLDDLRAVIDLARRAPFYAAHAARLGRLDSTADFSGLPFSTKEDFRADFTRFLTGEPASRVHTTSGSTGHPAMMVYSVHELMSITRRAVETQRLAGVGAEHRVLNLFGYGTFIAGNLYDWGATSIGATVIPFGSATMTPPDFSAQAIRVLAPEVVNGVPSYLVRFLGDLGREDGSNLNRVRIIQCAGEVLTPGLRRRLAELCEKADVFDQYGMTEFGPLAAECPAHDGLHLLDDGLRFEVIDESGDAIADGEGELTITSLRNRAMVLLRYRTGDQVAVRSDTCRCGREGRRIRVLRRADDLTKIRGVLCSKNEIVDAVRSIAGVSAFSIRIYRDESDVDRLDVAISVETGEAEEDAARTIGLQVRDLIRNRVRVGADSVEVLPELELPRTVSGKPVFITDERAAHDESAGDGRQRQRLAS